MYSWEEQRNPGSTAVTPDLGLWGEGDRVSLAGECRRHSDIIFIHLLLPPPLSPCGSPKPHVPPLPCRAQQACSLSAPRRHSVGYELLRCPAKTDLATENRCKISRVQKELVLPLFCYSHFPVRCFLPAEELHLCPSRQCHKL